MTKIWPQYFFAKFPNSIESCKVQIFTQLIGENISFHPYLFLNCQGAISQQSDING
jgi:hypothetical protein